ncbi:hypothetical protein [Methyloceanibacter sp.]|uniref:hypothetical protein n=1 Tax=Methyloceanibacter sp. TaxID=1965321 RepID=UPI003D6D25E7
MANLADRTFLNLWCYPNVFIDKRTGARGDGKELCDLLVVCGDHVLVFSDKTVAWPKIDDVGLAWRRWFKRAVLKSAQQVQGAARWIDQFPDRIFLDRRCTQLLPLQLPPRNRRKFHGVVVALGAGRACQEFFGGGSGSLMICPDLKADDHLREAGFIPFAIGDISPASSFVHVFDDATFDVVMRELDTVADFTDYLTKKEALVRSGHLVAADGEEDLLAYYMTHVNSEGEHAFTRPDGAALRNNDSIVISTCYSDLRAHPQYIAKRKADEPSYVWDRLIEAFTNHMLAGTTIVPDGAPFDIRQHEQAIRHMALVPRYLRRPYGDGILDVLQKGTNAVRYTRAFIPPPTSARPETGFFFMTLSLPKTELDGGYEQYRLGRRTMLEAYAFTFLERYRHLERVVGIATEPAPRPGSRTGSSEDLIVAEVSEWTDEFLESLRQQQEEFLIVREGNFEEYAIRGKEFPDIDHAGESTSASRPNRHKRRAIKAKARKSKGCEPPRI